MKKQVLMWCLMCLLWSNSLKVHAQNASQTVVPKITKSLFIGETRILVAKTQKSGSEMVLFNMHEDENTSVKAANDILKRYGGKMISLNHTGARNIVFRLNGKNYTVDPNRIFTDLGIQKTLERNSTFHSDAAMAVKVFAESLIVNYGLNHAKLLIALHNNTPDNYHVRNYERGQVYENDAEAVNYVDGSDYDDFFFVTERRFFDALKQEGFNAALQNNRTVTDDGSFSVFCGNRNIPYINVEAQHGHVQEQIRMLEAVLQLFGR